MVLWGNLPSQQHYLPLSGSHSQNTWHGNTDMVLNCTNWIVLVILFSFCFNFEGNSRISRKRKERHGLSVTKESSGTCLNKWPFQSMHPPLAHVHVLDLMASGVIKPHIDSVRVSGIRSYYIRLLKSYQNLFFFITLLKESRVRFSFSFTQTSF